MLQRFYHFLRLQFEGLVITVLSTTFFWFLAHGPVKAQAPVADFTVPSAACRQQSISFENQSTGFSRLEWDLCQGDLLSTPLGANVLPLSGNVTTGLDIVFDGTSWFGFITNQNANNILRLDFGNSITNTPQITNLGNVSNLINRPTDIKVVNENGNWYGFVYALNGPKISRIDFGNKLTNTTASQDPISAQTILAGNGDTNGGFDMIFDGTNWIIVLTSNTTLQIIKLPSINTTPLPPDIISGIVNPTANGMGDIVLQKSGNNYYGFVVAFANKTFQKIEFGSSLLNAPVFTDISAILPVGPTPYGIDMGFDNGKFYSFIASLEGTLIRIDHGSDLSLPPVSGVSLGALSVLENTLKIKLVKNGSSWFAFTPSWSSTNLYRANFVNPDCEFNVLTENDPAVIFTQAGEKNITLRSFNADGVFDEKNGQISISTEIAPQLGIVPADLCNDDPTEFTLQTSSPLLTHNWKFGDGLESTDLNPTHQYDNEGLYSVQVDVTGTNGCGNRIVESVSIYEVPQVSFTLPSGLICTNSEFLFQNNTPDTFDETLIYDWKVEGNSVAATRDLRHVFLTGGGSKQITLTAFNAGCTASLTQSTSPILVGAAIDFSVTGRCEDATIQMTTIVTESVSQHHWEFGDNQSSTLENPTHIFSDAGTYQVSLSAASVNGCVNTKTKAVAIHEIPLPDFITDGPPSSCSGASTVFTDLTPDLSAGLLEQWEWNFGDGEAALSQNPAHIFRDAGDYDVELTVTSEDGCSNSTTKRVTILQSPSATFSNGPSCVTKVTSFTASSDNAIQYYWEIGTSYYETQNAIHTFNSSGSHPVKLNVVGANDCVTTLTKNIVVPLPVNPVFSATNNCKDFQTRFTFASASTDPVVAQNWNFAGEAMSTEKNPSYTFQSLGNKLVTLQVTTASGCVYERPDAVNIIEPPVANFTFTPGFGVPPQEISFINSSSNATSFNWSFDDGGTSTENSPRHVFTELGDYEVELTATNSAACQTSASKVVSMVAPLPDVDLSLMTIAPNVDGTSKVIVTIANKGNTFLKNLPIRLDVSGNVTLETIVQETIAPFSMYNLVLDFGIAQSGALEFLCASTTLDGDLHPEGNRICSQLKSEVAILSPYPNPVKDALTVEWVAQEGEAVVVKLDNTVGNSVIDFTETSAAGLNQKRLDVSNLRSGIYILRIMSPTHTKTHRILVSN